MYSARRVNIVNGFFGGMGGCAMIGQFIINIKSGGRGRLSGIVAALALLFFILFASTYRNDSNRCFGRCYVYGCYWNFCFEHFKIWNKIPLTDVIVIVLVTVMTVLFDLAIAVIAGALFLFWSLLGKMHTNLHESTPTSMASSTMKFTALFFGSVELFNSKFDVKNDPQEVVVDFAESRVMDQSAIEALNKLAERYQKNGKQIHLRHLSADCVKLIKKAENMMSMY